VSHARGKHSWIKRTTALNAIPVRSVAHPRLHWSLASRVVTENVAVSRGSTMTHLSCIAWIVASVLSGRGCCPRVRRHPTLSVNHVLRVPSRIKSALMSHVLLARNVMVLVSKKSAPRHTILSVHEQILLKVKSRHQKPFPLFLSRLPGQQMEEVRSGHWRRKKTIK